MRHTDDKVCPLCQEKLKTAHPLLERWFNTTIKPEFVNAHISWAYRGKDDQNKAYKEGVSQVKWPNSKHNKTTSEGALCSEAIDLFEQVNGRSKFDSLFYAHVNGHIDKCGWENFIKWGLTRNIKGHVLHYDKCHFEVIIPQKDLNRG